MNELLLIITLLIEFTLVVLAYKFFGKKGLFAWIALATVLANVEVLLLVKAFGIEMTLGNVLFASTFLATDILSEKYDKKTAQQGVFFGIAASVVFLVISASWLLYRPSANDMNFEFFHDIFAKTPRIIIASVVVYAIAEFLDVFLYHKVWKATSKAGDRKRGLWIRNNVATIVSQIVNAVLYNLLAFGGVYPANTMVSIIVANILIYVATSFADTPFLYLARSLEKCKKE